MESIITKLKNPLLSQRRILATQAILTAIRIYS